MMKEISLLDKLKLEAAVNLGLPVDFAGKVIEIGMSNTYTTTTIFDIQDRSGQ